VSLFSIFKVKDVREECSKKNIWTQEKGRYRRPEKLLMRSLINFTFHKILLEYSNHEYEMDGECSGHGKGEEWT
jgi:hypothetical protein